MLFFQNMETIDTAPFRILIVGGGISGLIASHCLQLANIEHVVFEQREDIAPAQGASIAIYPNGARILSQIGCLDAVRSRATTCSQRKSRSPDGTLFSATSFFRHIKESLGQDVLLIERRQLLEVLYDRLPDKLRVRAGVSVKNISSSESHVEIRLQDGSVEKGDLVMGCDGVYSTVRRYMWEVANAEAPGSISEQEKLTLKVKWMCLVGIGPNTPQLGTNDMTVVHDTQSSFLILTQPNRTFWFCFSHVDGPLGWPYQRAYSAADIEAVMGTIAKKPITDELKFRDLWEQRERAEIVPIEEGIFTRWHAGRVVIVGDAAHKVTPNIALGGNAAMESVVVLCNELHGLVVGQQLRTKPNLKSLQGACEAYQKRQEPRVRQVLWVSRFVTNLEAWGSTMHRFLANWIIPFLPERTVPDFLARVLRGAPEVKIA
ncbi:FAD binding domain protein [Xylariaceae sp. FL1272]|nr:FAD binding domain protein [Xylariaceae sp. FL1272]